MTNIAALKTWMLIGCIGLCSGCGWLQQIGHREAGSGHGEERGEEHGPHAHHDDEHDHRMYGGWDTAQYPTAVNLYRAMNLIAETRDPIDSGRPSHAEMFVATFSEAYVRYKPDSAVMQQLRAWRGNAAYVRFSGAPWDEATHTLMPRLVRVLDLLRTDSVQLQYRSRGLNGGWHYRADLESASWPQDTVFPSVEVFKKSGGSKSFTGKHLQHPEFCLLEGWRS